MLKENLYKIPGKEWIRLLSTPQSSGFSVMNKKAI